MIRDSKSDKLKEEFVDKVANVYTSIYSPQGNNYGNYGNYGNYSNYGYADGITDDELQTPNTNNYNTPENIDVKLLWRWFRSLITDKRDMYANANLNPNSNSNLNANSNFNANNNLDSQRENDKIYRELCEGIIKDYCLSDVNELRSFINDLLTKNLKNNKRVEKMKKLLLAEPGMDPNRMTREQSYDS